MRVKNVLLALLMTWMGVAVCPAQDGETTVEGVPVVEEIVSDSSMDDDGIIGGANTQTTTRVGSWSVTYTNDTISSEDAEEMLKGAIDEIFGFGTMDNMMKTLSGGLLLVTILAIGIPIFFIILIIVIFYFIYKGRKAKYDAYKSIAESGQTIPEEELRKMSEPVTDRTTFNKGIKNICLGVGLAIFLGIIMGNFGIGIGALVTCIGIGELLVDYFAKK